MQLYDTFTTLVRERFVERCPSVAKTTEPSNIPLLFVDEHLLHSVPAFEAEEAKRKRKREADSDTEPAAKRVKTESGPVAATNAPQGEPVTYWKINYNTFHHCLRDQVINNAILHKFDEKASEIVRAILKISSAKTGETAPVTTPVSLHEIRNSLPPELKKKVDLGKVDLGSYLTVLAEDSCGFVVKVGDSGGGMYSIHVRNALTSLAKAHIESVIQERFGSKSLRIVKLLMAKRHLEQKQIEDIAMIPAKEAKEMLYHMFGQHFVTITEVARTPDHAPSRTFYLFSVDVGAVVRMLLEHSYKALGNLITRRLHETHENKRLLDKQHRVEAIMSEIADPAQKEELEEIITPPEKEQLAKIKRMTDQLEQSELQLDDTIFVLEMYLRFSSNTT